MPAGAVTVMNSRQRTPDIMMHGTTTLKEPILSDNRLGRVPEGFVSKRMQVVRMMY